MLVESPEVMLAELLASRLLEVTLVFLLELMLRLVKLRFEAIIVSLGKGSLPMFNTFYIFIVNGVGAFFRFIFFF